MPGPVASASSCTRLCQATRSRTSSTPPARLKWLSRISRIAASVAGRPNGLSAPINCPPGIITTMSWNISPALSSSVSRASRSATRFCTLFDGS